MTVMEFSFFKSGERETKKQEKISGIQKQSLNIQIHGVPESFLTAASNADAPSLVVFATDLAASG